jgi:hypothetical protein
VLWHGRAVAQEPAHPSRTLLELILGRHDDEFVAAAEGARIVPKIRLRHADHRIGALGLQDDRIGFAPRLRGDVLLVIAPARFERGGHRLP